MSYFTDLTPYCYGREAPQADILNVGWLAIDAAPVPTGEVPAGFVERLTELAARPVNKYRGHHACDLCRGTHVRPWPDSNGEIRVTAAGITYVAPQLIAHYVGVHKYLPPQAFIDAVMADA